MIDLLTHEIYFKMYIYFLFVVKKVFPFIYVV